MSATCPLGQNLDRTWTPFGLCMDAVRTLDPTRPVPVLNPPPSPLQGEAFDPVPIEVRRQRVRNGSRRQRDLVAVREADAQEVAALLAAVPENPAAATSWNSARDQVRANVSESTFRLWIEPLRAVGEDGSTLYLSAPEGIRAWAERRYSSLIGEVLRDCSEFESVRFVPGWVSK